MATAVETRGGAIIAMRIVFNVPETPDNKRDREDDDTQVTADCGAPRCGAGLARSRCPDTVEPKYPDFLWDGAALNAVAVSRVFQARH
jgi:hypothetical protein